MSVPGRRSEDAEPSPPPTARTPVHETPPPAAPPRSPVALVSVTADPGPRLTATAESRPAAGPPSSVAARLRDPGHAPGDALALAREMGLSITGADVLHRRGLHADDATRRYLDPRLSHLTPPDAMADRDASAERLA